MKVFSTLFAAAVLVACNTEAHYHGHGDEGWGWGWGSSAEASRAPAPMPVTTGRPVTSTAAGTTGRPATSTTAGTTGRPVTSTASATSTTTASTADIAKRNLDTLEKQCIAEGARVIVYAGGDTPEQQDGTKRAFQTRFPKVTLDIIVDYSKNHDVRIDLQLSQKKLVPDVVQLQTVQDFPRWRDAGVLLAYKPPGWEAIYDEAKDPNGYFTAIAFYYFTNLVNKRLIPNPANWPREAKDYLRPNLKNHITLTYPHDDDAILYWFKLITDVYGMDYVNQLVAQNVTWVRGTQEPYDAEERNAATAWACPSTAGDMSNPPEANSVFLLPAKDPFMTWPQTAAIFKDAKRPACAKLYMSWTLDASTQMSTGTWSPRRDVPPPAGYKSLFDYPKQTNPYSFGKWMEDRAAIERFKTLMALLIGEVKGEPSPGHLGLYQDVALPHKFTM